MSVQPAPTNIGTPLYNLIFYINPNSSSGITVSYLNQNYLKFPTAQGTEEFPNGLFSVGAIDFNSSNGTDRVITGVSKSSFTDILGNTSYTSYIEENSTAIGSYNGGLIINSSDTINLQGNNVLVNGVPITTGGGGDVYTNQVNTYTLGSINYFDNAQFCSGTLQLFNYSSASSIPQGQIGGSFTYNGIACINNLPYFYPQNSNPYLAGDWEAIALGQNYNYVNPTLSGDILIGTSQTDTIDFNTSTFSTSINNTIINTINQLSTGTNNVMIGYNSDSGFIQTGCNNTIIGSNIQFTYDISGNVIIGSGTLFNNSATNSVAIGNDISITNNNCVIFGVGNVSTKDNQISLGTITQFTYVPSGYLCLQPITLPTTAPTINNFYIGQMAIDQNTNNINVWDGLYWNKMTQKNYSFGYNNTNGLKYAVVNFNWNASNLGLAKQSLITLHMNFSYAITDTSVSPNLTTTLMVSGAMVVLDLYAIMVMNNYTPFNTSQTINNPPVSNQYTSGYADLGMVKVLQPSGSDWLGTYPNYPQILVNGITYNSGSQSGQVSLNFYPATPATTFPTTISSGMNGVIEFKNDNFMPSPYKSSFTSSNVLYPV